MRERLKKLTHAIVLFKFVELLLLLSGWLFLLMHDLLINNFVKILT